MNEKWEKLRIALENDKFKWRTLSGLSEESGMTNEELRKLLEAHVDTIVKSSVPSSTGAALYTTRKHYKKKSSALGAIRQSLTGRVR